MSEGDRRSAKLHKQTEVDDDSEEGISTPPPPSQPSPPPPPTSTTTIANQTSGVQCKNLCNIPTPTVVPASSSSSSETSPEEPPTPTPPQPPATLSRKQTLTRTPAFEGTSPPPETFLAHHDPSSSDHSSSSTTTTTIISAGSNGGSNSSRSIIPSISTTSPPLVTTSTHPVPNGGTVTVSTLSVTSDASSGTGRIRGISVAHQAKEFLLASHTVSNDSGRGTLDDSCDILHRESSVDTSGSLANISSSSPSTPPASSTPTSLSPAYTDSTGTDLIPFFKATLRKSPKDKKTLLAVEREIIAFIGDLASQSHKMNEMNPYDRMVAHRVAAYYGLDHNVDQSGKCIIVTRTTKTRMPDLKLCDIPNTLEEKRILLKKPSSLDEQQVKRLTTKDKFGTNRAKSLEERQQNYHEVRERIFKVDESPIVSKEGQSTSISSSNLLTHPSFQQHYHHHPPMSQQRSLDSMRDARQQQQQQHSTPHHHLHHQPHSFSRPLWSSTDSSGYESLGGPSIYESPPSHSSTHELSNTPTGSMSDQSPASRPASETGHSPLTQPPPQYQPTVTYLVTTDLANKPSNSCIINPETMQPHVNPDGTTVYQYDVSCPPPFMMGAAQPAATATQISPAGFVYQTDPVYDLTSRFAGTSLTPMEGMVAGGPDHMTLGIQPGQTVSLVPSQGQPSNLIQTQYINGSQVVGQPVRYIYTLPPAGGGAGGSVGVGPPIHQPHLTSSPAAGPVVLDASAHHHHHPSLHPAAHHHPHHQVTTVVPMPSTAVAASPMIPTAVGNGATAGGYQIINPSTAYIQTANGLSGVNLNVTPVPVSSSAVVGGSIPIDLSSLTPEQQQSVLAAAAAGGGTVVCSNPNGPQQTLSALVNHPQAFPPGGVAHPQAVTAATAAIPVSGGAPNVIQAYTIAPYQLSNVATLPLAHHHQQQQQQQQLQQQQQQQQLLQHHLQHQSSLTHTHLVQSQQQQQHPQHGSSSVPTPSIPPPSSSMPPPASSSASAAAFFTGMPLTNTSNSPSPLSHQTQQHPPPPPHHHPHHHHTHPHQHQLQQQQQPAIVYNIGGVPMISTLPPTSSSLSLPPPPPPPPPQPASSSSSSLSSSKSNPGPASSSIGGQFTTTSTSSSSSGSSSTSAYQQTPPPGAPTMQQLHHPHHHHHHQHPPPPPPSSSSSTPSSSSNNGYHSHPHPHLHSHPSSYSQSPSSISTISFIPNQSQHHTGAAPTQQQQAMMTGSGGNGSPQLVTIPTAATATGSPYQHPQLRPMNTIIPMPGVPGAPGSTTAAPTHFQLVRPTGPMQDVRMLQPGAFPTRLPSVPIYAPFAQQAGRPRGSNPNRPGKGSKKYGSRESGYGQVSGAALQQHPQSQPQPQQPPQRKQHTPQPQQQPLVAAPPPPPQQHQIAPSSTSIFPSPHLPPASCRP